MGNTNEQHLLQTHPSGCFPPPTERTCSDIAGEDGEESRRAERCGEEGKEKGREGGCQEDGSFPQSSVGALGSPPPCLGANPHLVPQCACVSTQAHTHRDTGSYTHVSTYPRVCKAYLPHKYVPAYTYTLHECTHPWSHVHTHTHAHIVGCTMPYCIHATSHIGVESPIQRPDYLGPNPSPKVCDLGRLI